MTRTGSPAPGAAEDAAALSTPRDMTYRGWMLVAGRLARFAKASPQAFWLTRLAAILLLDAAAVIGTLRLTRAVLPHARTLGTVGEYWFYAAFVAATLGSLFAVGLYRRSWRFLSAEDCLALGSTLAASSALVWLVTATWVIPQKVHGADLLAFIAVHAALMVLAMVGLRYLRRRMRRSIRGIRAQRRRVDPVRSVLLLGELDWARVMVDLTRTDANARLDVVGVLTFDGRERKLQVGGARVLGNPEMLPDIVARLARDGKRPTSLVVQDAGEMLDRAVALRITTLCETLDLALCRFRDPWTRTPAGHDRVDIEKMPLAELLGRPEVSIQHSYVEQVVTGRRIMVTGAGGTIGGELVRQLAAYGPAEITLLDHAEYSLYAIEIEARERFPDIRFHAELCSVRQRQALFQVFARRRPEIVFHAAALKHVPMVEANPCAGVHTNVIGTRNVADAVCEYEVRAMVQVSTDKAVNPVGLMGATKRLGELYCQALDLIGSCDPDSPRFLTVRFGNVLGSSGSLIPLFQRQLAAGKPLTVTHPDIERFFMTVQEAVLLILQSSARALATDSDRGMIFVLDMGEPVKIVEIARRVIRMNGLRPDVDVPIRFIGLRPGEKLYEELFDTTESKIESAIPGIFEAMPSPVPLGVLVQSFLQLERLIQTGDGAEIARLTHEMVAASATSRWRDVLTRLAADADEAGGGVIPLTPPPAALPRSGDGPARLAS